MIMGVLLGLTIILSGIFPNFSYLIIPLGLGAVLFTRYIGKWWFQRKVRNLIVLCKEFIDTDKKSDASKNLNLAVSTLEKARKDGDVVNELRFFRLLKREWKKIAKDSSKSATPSKQRDSSSVRARKSSFWRWVIVLLLGAGVIVLLVAFWDELGFGDSTIVSRVITPAKGGVYVAELQKGYSYSFSARGVWQHGSDDRRKGSSVSVRTANCNSGANPKWNPPKIVYVNHSFGSVPLPSKPLSIALFFTEEGTFMPGTVFVPTRDQTLRVGPNYYQKRHHFSGNYTKSRCVVNVSRRKL